MSKLSEKQRRACRELMQGGTQEEACIRAGYSSHGCKAAASRLFARPEAKAYLTALRAPIEAKAQIDAARVLEEYGKLAFLDPRQFFDADGELIDIHKLPAEVAAALAGMDVSVERVGTDADGKPKSARVCKIKFADKKGALDSLAKHLGMFIDRAEITQKREVDLPEPLRKLLSVYDD